MKEQSHFDRHGATYDHDELHHRIVSLLIGGAEIKPEFCVLDVATGTGLLALKAVQQVGPAGKVIGIDLSKGMLAEAHHKAVEAGLRNIEFVQADAEQLAFPRESFDCIFCSSAIVLMSDIPRALRRWFDFLKPHGIIAFDAPAKPFGISQRVADIAAEHGVRLAYANIADTLIAQTLQAAGFDVTGARDLDSESLRAAFTDFLDKAQASGPDTVAFVYLAGYGLQLDGENYFVPVDAKIASAQDVAVEALRVSDYTKRLAGEACRASPQGELDRS